jgi:hypothetical protein
VSRLQIAQLVLAESDPVDSRGLVAGGAEQSTKLPIAAFGERDDEMRFAPGHFADLDLRR